MIAHAPLTLLSPVPAHELSAVHRAAVSYGANDTGSSREVEMQATPTQLLSLAIRRVPDVSLSAFVVQTLGGGRRDERLDAVVSRLKIQAAGTIRLCQRALEVHGRNVGYDLREWSISIVETTSALLYISDRAAAHGEPCSTPVDELRAATRAISQAIEASENDRMAVPDHLSDAIGRLLLLFMLASELGARRGGRG
jgi:hypothetical protein